MITLPPTLSPYRGTAQPLMAVLDSPTWAARPAKTFELGLGYRQAPGITQTAIALTTSGTNTQTFTLPTGTQRVEVVYYGSERYTLAADPTNLQPGEFTVSSLTGQIQVRPRTSFKAGYALTLQVADPTAVLVNYALSSTAGLPAIFSQYELRGAIAWSCDWEGHPQGAFELLCDWATADALEQQLIPRQTQLDLFGIGFEVASLKIKKRSPLECPILEATVSVSLRGKWERLLEESVAIEKEDFYGNTPAGPRTIWGDTTAGAIAQLVGVPTAVPNTIVEAPKQDGQQVVVTLKEPLEGVLRPNGSFIRYSNAAQIEAVRLDDVTTHTVTYNDLYNTDLQFSVNAYPVALDYRNCPLQWGDKVPSQSDYSEDTQGKAQQKLPSQWRLKPPKLESVTVGSPTLVDPPSDIRDLIDPSFVFDNGGPTKEQTTTYTENGAIVRQEFVKFGFVAVAYLDLYTHGTRTDDSGNLVDFWSPRDPGIIPELWQQVEGWACEYFYDPDTGYLLGTNLKGFRIIRLKTEQQNESLAAYDDWSQEDQTTPDADSPNSLDPKTIKLLKLQAYEYSVVPISEQAVFYTQYLRSHYNDIPPRPTEDYVYTVPKFKDDGTINTQILIGDDGTSVTETTVQGKAALQIKTKLPVPGWTDPQYCEFEAARKWCFLSQPDPESTDEKPLPDMQSGEDKETERLVHVGNYRNRPKKPQPGTWIQAETLIEYQRIHTQKESGFRRSAKEVQEDLKKGRPSEHTRKEKIYEKYDPNEGVLPNDEYEYTLSTASYADTRIKGQSLSYSYARTLAEALTAALTDYRIINSRDTKTTDVTLNYSTAIREGDLLQLEGHSTQRVKGYSKSMVILAPGVIQPARMTLQLGKEIPTPTPPNLILEKRLIPKPPTTDPATGQVTGGSSKFNSGSLVSGRSRGNKSGR